MLKQYIQKKLETRAQQFFAKNTHIRVVAVVGSIGKTTTKHHIGTLLSTQYRVRMHDGNFNSEFGVPLSILGLPIPRRLRSVIGWLSVLRAARYQATHSADFDVLIVELGVDRPGDMANFARYLHPNVSIVTAVTPEHMEFFGTLDAVAKEELGVASFSDAVLINRDDIDVKYAVTMITPNFDTYGSSGASEYRYEIDDFSLSEGYVGKIIAPEFPDGTPANVSVIGEHSLRPVMGAIAVAVKLGVTPDNIIHGLDMIRPTPGRMNVLEGRENSRIIDDTYNSSPAAAEAALRTLYSVEAPQRIALLGDMNELGATSAEEHRKLGDMCDPSLLAWVVTVGEQAATYLAPAARARGNQVKSFRTALEAGAFVNSVLEDNSIILAKGSQGGIYLEEAIKIFLRNSDESNELVRQSTAWKAKKQAFFDSQT